MAQGAAGKSRNSVMAGPGLVAKKTFVQGWGGGKEHDCSMAEVQERLSSNFLALEREISAINKSDLPEEEIYLEAKLRPDYLAMSYNPYRVFDYIGGITVGSKQAMSNLLSSKEGSDRRKETPVLLEGVVGEDHFCEMTGSGFEEFEESGSGSHKDDESGVECEEGYCGQGSDVETKSIFLRLPLEKVSRIGQLVKSIDPENEYPTDESIQHLRYIDSFQVAECELLESESNINTDSSGNAGQVLWEAVLHPADRNEPCGSVPQDQREYAIRTLNPCSDEVLSRFCKKVVDCGGVVHEDYIRRQSGLTFVPFTGKLQIANEVMRYNPVRQLCRVPEVTVPATVVGAEIFPSVSGSGNVKPLNSTVAIIGPGYDDLAKVSKEWNLEKYTTEIPDQDTLLAGAAMAFGASYGYKDSFDELPPSSVKVTSYRVWPPPATVSVPSYWVLDKIKEAVQRHATQVSDSSPVVMLGVLLTAEADPAGRPSLWSATLDDLALRFGVVFIIPIGDTQCLGEEPARMLSPTDSVYSIVVGASEGRDKRKYSDSNQILNRADYSRVGPGKNGSRIRPTVSRFGGTAKDPLLVTLPDGAPYCGRGTALSAAAVLNDFIHATESFSAAYQRPEILRALAAHCVLSPKSRTDKKRRFSDIGFGKGGHLVDRLIAGDSKQFSVVIPLNLFGGEIQPLVVPVPKGYTNDVELDVTAAYFAPVDPAEASECTSAAIRLRLRPHEERYVFENQSVKPDERKRLTRSLPQARDEGLAFPKWVRAKKPAIADPYKAGSSNEHGLRSNGKWETVVKASYKLSPEKVSKPRLDVCCFTRHAGRSARRSLCVPVAVIMTLTASNDDVRFYTKINQEFGHLLSSMVSGQLRLPGSGLV